MRLAELLDALDYTAFPQYYLKTDQEHSPDLAPLFRSAKDAGVDGIYVVESGQKQKNFLPVRPVVYVAEAQTPEEAREIHRCLWNLGQAPFLIVVLPNQIRVYTGGEPIEINELSPGCADSFQQPLVNFAKKMSRMGGTFMRASRSERDRMNPMNILMLFHSFKARSV